MSLHDLADVLATTNLDAWRRDDKALFDVLEDPDEAKMTTEAIIDPNWQWLAYNEERHESGRVKYVRTSKKPDRKWKGSPFQVIYCIGKSFWPDAVLVKIKSKYLIEVLRKLMPHKGLQHLEKADLPGRDLYVIQEELKQLLSQFGDEPVAAAGVSQVQDSVTSPVINVKNDTETSESSSKRPRHDLNVHLDRAHLQHLLRFLSQEYKEAAVRHQRMKEDKTVSFDMLWAFFKHGEQVIYTSHHTLEPLRAVVVNNNYVSNAFGSVLMIDLEVFDYNGDVYRKCQIKKNIRSFVGECPFHELEIRPLATEDRAPEIVEAEFISKGRRFEELAIKSSHRFMHYRGPMFTQPRTEIFKENADGRVMIDIRSFAKMNPQYPMRNAQPPTVIGASDDLPPHTPAELQAIRKYNVVQQVRRHQSEDLMLLRNNKTAQQISDEDITFAPAIVYGFSFALRKWGAFAVLGFSEISFDDEAFSSLVMDAELKGLVQSLVCQYSTGLSQGHRVDPIANKGEGIIFLCYGPPGTGKTLTAESIAENMHRPLWSLCVSELGTTPDELEKTLVKILTIAAVWKAVVLLDEADVYLEKRSASVELTRNAMTGIFLRLLEYFRGVLFLTSNRITTFDDAFRSRISLFLCYPPLQAEQRAQIWRTSLARVHVENLDPDFVADIAKKDFNGREIRNAIHTAQMLARSRDQELQEEHVRFVMRVMASSKETLDAALLHSSKSQVSVVE